MMKLTRGLAAAAFVAALLPAPVALAEDASGFKDITYVRFAPKTAGNRLRTTLHVRADGAFTIVVDQSGSKTVVLEKTGSLYDAERKSLASAFAGAGVASLPSDLRPRRPFFFSSASREWWQAFNDSVPYTLSVDGGTVHTGYLGVPRDEATGERVEPLVRALEGIVFGYAGLAPNGELTYEHWSPLEPKSGRGEHFILTITKDGYVTLERSHRLDPHETFFGRLNSETVRALAEARKKAGRFKDHGLTDVNPQGYTSPGVLVLDVVPHWWLRLVDAPNRMAEVQGCVGRYSDEQARKRLEPLVTLLEQIAASFAEMATPKTKPAAATPGITSSVPR
jgi:hypothetical protein